MGNVRFVLTHLGPRLYDEDCNLYYTWRRPSSGPLGAVEAEAEAEAAEAAAPAADAAGCPLEPHSSWAWLAPLLVAVLARGLVLALAALLACGLYLSLQLALTYVLLPLSRRPLLSLGLALSSPIVVGAARAVYRFATEGGGDEDDDSGEEDEEE